MPVYEYYCSSCATKFEKLRPMAQKQVEGAAPRLAALLEKHAAPTG